MSVVEAIITVMIVDFKMPTVDIVERRGTWTGFVGLHSQQSATLADHPENSKQQHRADKTEEDCFTIYKEVAQHEAIIGQASDNLKKKFFLSVLIEDRPCQMELDTGSSVSIISWATLTKLVPSMVKSRLTASRLRLRDYQGNHIPIIISDLPCFVKIQLAISKFFCSTQRFGDCLKENIFRKVKEEDFPFFFYRKVPLKRIIFRWNLHYNIIQAFTAKLQLWM